MRNIKRGHMHTLKIFITGKNTKMGNIARYVLKERRQVTKFEGKTSFAWPYCQKPFELTELSECKVRNNLVEDLVLKCKCGLEFKQSQKGLLFIYKGRQRHDGGRSIKYGSLP